MSIDQLPSAVTTDESTAPRHGAPTWGALVRRPALWVLAAGYVLSLALLLRIAWLSRFVMSNIDGISYMSLARQYADGSFDTAVNAFWSPLVTWLMVPLVAAGLSGILSFVLVNVLGAAIGIGVGTALVWRHTQGNAWAAGIYQLGSTVFYASTLYLLTPDLWVVTWVVVFVGALSYTSDAVFLPGRRPLLVRGAVLGTVCAVGYLTKLYLVPVMIVVIPLWAGLVLWRARNEAGYGRPARGDVLRTAGVLGVSLAVFAMLSAPWMVALSTKYGYPTMGSSFTVNIESKFEPGTATEVSPPLRMWSPPNERAVSFGEDRTFDSDGPAFASSAPLAERVTYYVQQRIAAFPHYLNRVASIAPFAALTVAAFVVALLFGRFRAAEYRLARISAVVWLVYFAGYAGITTAANSGGSPRYYWPLLPVWLLFVCSLLPSFLRHVGASANRWRSVIAAVLVAVVPLSVVWQFGLGYGPPFSTADGPRGVRESLATVPEPGAVQALAQDHLSAVVRPGDTMLGSNFRTTVQLGYFLEAQVFGRAAQSYDPDDPAFRQMLRDTGIEYYLYYSPHSLGVPQPAGLGLIGETIMEYDVVVPCADLAAALPEMCRVSLVSVDPVAEQ